jgi:hypothetical protein
MVERLGARDEGGVSAVIKENMSKDSGKWANMDKETRLSQSFGRTTNDEHEGLSGLVRDLL